MKLPVTPAFEADERRFSLRHHCEDCVLYDAERDPAARCAHGYPTHEHERAVRGAELVFCKEFEVA